MAPAAVSSDRDDVLEFVVRIPRSTLIGTPKSFSRMTYAELLSAAAVRALQETYPDVYEAARKRQLANAHKQGSEPNGDQSHPATDEMDTTDDRPSSAPAKLDSATRTRRSSRSTKPSSKLAPTLVESAEQPRQGDNYEAPRRRSSSGRKADPVASPLAKTPTRRKADTVESSSKTPARRNSRAAKRISPTTTKAGRVEKPKHASGEKRSSPRRSTPPTKNRAPLPWIRQVETKYYEETIILRRRPSNGYSSAAEASIDELLAARAKARRSPRKPRQWTKKQPFLTRNVNSGMLRLKNTKRK